MQVQGEFLYYHTQHDGQVDVGLVNRWKKVQLGVFSNIKFAEEDAFLKDGGTLGQASAVLDIFFTAVRLNIFATKGFKDIGILNEDTSYAITGGTALPTTTQDLARVADTLGAGVLFAIGPNDDIEGSLAWLRRAKPTTLGDRAGVMARYTHHFNPRVRAIRRIHAERSGAGTDQQRPRDRGLRLRQMDETERSLQQAHTVGDRGPARPLRPGDPTALTRRRE